MNRSQGADRFKFVNDGTLHHTIDKIAFGKTLVPGDDLKLSLCRAKTGGLKTQRKVVCIDCLVTQSSQFVVSFEGLIPDFVVQLQECFLRRSRE